MLRRKLQDRVLFVRHLAAGDVLLTTPFLRALRSQNPDITVDLYSLAGEVYGGNKAFGRWLSIRKTPPKKALDLGHEHTFWFSYEQDPTLHILDGYEQSTGLTLQDRTLEWVVNEEEMEEARFWLEDVKRPLVGFSPFCEHGMRSLTPAKAQAIIDRVIKTFGIPLLVTADRPRPLSNCINFTGRMSSVRELAAIMSLCDAWITIDSGPLHLAQALGIPALGLFGCTLPELRATWPSGLRVVRHESLPCLGCYHGACDRYRIPSVCVRGDQACMEGLNEDGLARELDKTLQRMPDEVLRARVDDYETYRYVRMHAAGEKERREKILHEYQAFISNYDKDFQPLRNLERTLRKWRKAV